MTRDPTVIRRRRCVSRTHVQLLVGHARLEPTVRYLGIEIDDALEIFEQPKI